MSGDTPERTRRSETARFVVMELFVGLLASHLFFHAVPRAMLARRHVSGGPWSDRLADAFTASPMAAAGITCLCLLGAGVLCVRRRWASVEFVAICQLIVLALAALVLLLPVLEVGHLPMIQVR